MNKEEKLFVLTQLNSRDAVSFLATFINITLFISGIQIIRAIYFRKSSKGFFVLPFASCMVCCLLWAKYGFLIEDNNVIFVNLLGSVIEGCYTCIFFLYAKEKGKVLSTVLPLLLFLFATLGYTKYVTVSGSIAVSHHGMICSMYNIFNYAAPLTAAVSVIKSRTTENLSVALTILYFLCAFFWYLYGYLNGDYYMIIPNLLGIIFGALQLCLFLIYPRSKSTPYLKL